MNGWIYSAFPSQLGGIRCLIHSALVLSIVIDIWCCAAEVLLAAGRRRQCGAGALPVKQSAGELCYAGTPTKRGRPVIECSRDPQACPTGVHTGQAPVHDALFRRRIACLLLTSTRTRMALLLCWCCTECRRYCDLSSRHCAASQWLCRLLSGSVA